MVSAFIMVSAVAGRAEVLADRLQQFDGVGAARVVAGDVDVIVEAESGDVSDVIHTVATRVRGLEDVVDTKTYVCLE